MKDPRKEMVRAAVWVGRAGILCFLVALWCLAMAFWADDHDVAFGYCVWAGILTLLASLSFWASRVGRPPEQDDLAELLTPDEGPPPIITRRRRGQIWDEVGDRAERGRIVHDEIAEALADPDKWERKRMALAEWARSALRRTDLVDEEPLRHDYNWQAHAYIDLASEVVVESGRITEYAPGWRCCPMCGGVQRAEPCPLCSDAGAIHQDGI